MNVPFHKPYITDDEIAEVVDSLKSGWITMGPKTVRFEEAQISTSKSPSVIYLNFIGYGSKILYRKLGYIG